MKKILLTLACLAAVTCKAQEVGTARFRGDYAGVLLPVGNTCTTERLLVDVFVYDNGEMRGEIFDYDGDRRASIEHRLDSSGGFLFNTGTNMLPPFPSCFPFCDPEPGRDWLMRGKANAKAGTIKGSVDARYQGGCKYSFTLYRRFKNN